jgi:hypothetical protein
MIPKAITRELDKLVRDRDRWKRRALDRAAVRSKDRKREIEARDKAVERLLFGVAIEGLAARQSRGAVGCLWRAIEALRPDIAETMKDVGLDGAHDALHRFFPQEDLS